MIPMLIEMVKNNPEVVSVGLAYVASEIIGASKLKSNGLLHLVFNIFKGAVEITLKKKEGK